LAPLSQPMLRQACCAGNSQTRVSISPAGLPAGLAAGPAAAESAGWSGSEQTSAAAAVPADWLPCVAVGCPAGTKLVGGCIHGEDCRLLHCGNGVLNSA